MRSFVAIAVLLVACSPDPVGAHTDVVDARLDGVGRVEVYLPAGDVDVVASDEAWVRAAVAWDGASRPAFAAEVIGGTAIVTLSCPDTATACRADLHLRVPADLPVEIHTGEGLVVADGFTEAVAIASEAGDVVLVGLSGHVTVTAKGGDVQGVGLHDVARVDVATEHGEVVLEVPAGAYALSLATDSGTVEVRNVVPAPDAPAEITVRTGSGDVLVQGW